MDLLDTLRQGGWPMIPLALCSLAAVTIIIERTLALRHATVIHKTVVLAIKDFSGEASVDVTRDICEMSRGALARIVEDVLHARHLNPLQIREAMYAAGRVQIGRLERGLIVLEIIAGISPLIGLLGTVLGMLTVFKAITAHGIGDPQVLANGISQALLTTIAGLCVAIPALAFHGWFTKRVDDLAAALQDHATQLVAKVSG